LAWVISASGDQQAVSLTAHRLLLMLTILEERVNERRDCGTGCENYQAAEHNKAKDDRQEPEFLSLFHKRPKLQ